MEVKILKNKAELVEENQSLQTQLALANQRFFELIKILIPLKAQAETSTQAEKDETVYGQVLGRAVQRIEKETDLVEKLDGIMPVAALDDLDGYVTTQERIFSGERLIEFEAELKRRCGKDMLTPEQRAYAPAAAAGGNVFLFRNSSSKKDRLSNMLAFGVTGDFTSLEHERVHTFQYPSLNEDPVTSLMEHQKQYEARIADMHLYQRVEHRLPMEIQAYYAQFESSELPPGEADRLSKLVHAIVSSGHIAYVSPDHIQPLHRTMATVGLQQMEKLRALGITHQAIAQAVQGIKWDVEREVYNGWEEMIQAEMCKRGVVPEMLLTMVEEEIIEREIRTTKIRLIAYEELIKELEEKIRTNATSVAVSAILKDPAS